MAAPEFEIVETPGVQDIFVTGIQDIEDLGVNARFYLYAQCRAIGCDGSPEHRIVARIVMSFDDIPSAVRMTINFLFTRMRARLARLRLYIVSGTDHPTAPSG